LDRVLHGEQYTEVLRPLPPKATLRHKGRIKDIFDKGKNALVLTEVTSYDARTGEPLVRNEITTFVRGAGGWGGERGPSTDIVPPERAPDAVITEKTHENQALLYRLSGDWNPLHADPGFARKVGFQRPILHGLCTFGYVGRHVIKAFADGDPRLFKSIRVRFADTVLPGETLRTEMWKEGERIIVRCKVVERDKVVISNAAVELYKEVPKDQAQPAAPGQASALA
jgi:3-hydroxyacyl-CoA dehydrogenase/3a,7a,12a-trihydroxy-5b-cholest-24-enoyl-CoA hydratase